MKKACKVCQSKHNTPYSEIYNQKQCESQRLKEELDEYLQDELASHSDGDKKMRQAEARALAKVLREKASEKLLLDSV